MHEVYQTDVQRFPYAVDDAALLLAFHFSRNNGPLTLALLSPPAGSRGLRGPSREREARLLVAAATEAAKVGAGSATYWKGVARQAMQVRKVPRKWGPIHSVALTP